MQNCALIFIKRWNGLEYYCEAKLYHTAPQGPAVEKSTTL